VNTTQVDFVNAIVYNSITGVQTYQYSYFVRNNIVGNDLNDEFKNLTVKDPCSPDPCLNGAPCSIGFGNNYVCFCPISYTGIINGHFYLKFFNLNFRKVLVAKLSSQQQLLTAQFVNNKLLH
jgi:hypothetical protein